MADGSCDAAFLIGAQIDAAIVDQVHAACPIVLVDGYSENDVLDSVVTDNLAGGRMAVERLIQAGHQDIAIIGTEPVSCASN